MKLSSVVHTIAASLILLLSPVAAVADVDVPTSGLPLGESPLRVDTGFSLVNITDVGEKEETLEFEGAKYLAWQYSRLSLGFPVGLSPEHRCPGTDLRWG